MAIELNKRLQRKFPDIEATVRMAGMDGLSVRNGTTADKEAIEEMLQETWESADDRFQP
ncbi:DinI-like family protein [Serratia bockelmannii]|uniref:DinI-like family protein n=1 Tax=Serratia bockelmannii TaxID=2703793 RepID=UPI0039049AF4